MYPDAACNPRPRDPPLTTATLPLRLKILEKSWSCTSLSAEEVMMGLYDVGDWAQITMRFYTSNRLADRV